MGTGNSKDFDTNALLRGGGHRMFANLGPWSLPQVKAVFKRFKKNDGNFGIERRQFLSLMSFKKPPVVDPGDIFNVLDTDHSGRIDCLEFVGMLGFCCDCLLDDKIEFLFEMCDFNMNGSLSQSEMVLMMSSTMRGLLKMSGTGLDADMDANLEKVAIEAFDVADNNRSGSIEVNEFKTWLRNNGTLINQVEKMTKSVSAAIQDRDCEDSAEEISDNELKAVEDGLDDDFINERRDRSIEVLCNVNENQGDEFMATKPWIGAIVEPSGFKFDPIMNDPPPGNLQLEWVHGYRCFDCRNNIKALRRKDGTGRSRTLLVYPAAGVGVVYDKTNHEQSFYIGHTDDIISLAVLDGHIVATGQIGKNPEIHIWDTDKNNQNLMTITGFHERGVTALAFSSDGQFLASVGLDNDHCIAIHNWKINKLVASGKGDQQKVLDMCFSPNNDEICMVGQKFIKLFDLKNGNRSLKGKKAILGKLGKIQSYLSCGYFGNSVIVGTSNGELYQIVDGRLTSVIQGHSLKSAVNSIYTFPEGMISGGKDGTLKIWDSHFKEIQTIDLVSLPSVNSSKPEIRSICIESNDGSIYVGTRASEIIEIKQNDLNHSQMLLTGHFDGELWGLANHPSTLEYCTCGEDKMIMIWDVRTRRLLRSTKAADKARCCAYSPNGQHIAVGLINGMVQVFDNSTLSEIARFQHSSKQISVLQYSPFLKDNGCILAVGSRDQKIYLYIVKDNKYGKKAICRGHSSYITHIDFSKDGQYLHSTCGAYELLFWNITGKRITSPSLLRDTEWNTWTAPLGWSVQGIWPKCSDGTDINAVYRNSTSDEIVTADDFGLVKLFKYPCTKTSAGQKMYMGHSSHVTNVCYCYSDSYVISTGGNDKSIFQWSHDIEEEEEIDISKPSDDVDTDEEGKVTEEGIKRRELEHIVASTAVPTGDEFMAVKPWLGSIFSPDKFQELPTMCDSPNVDVSLEWVYGYEAQSTRNNIRYTSLGEIIFHTAAVNVVYDSRGKKQRFNRDHGDDIIALACHPNGRYCATGEIGRYPRIIVYDTATMETSVILQKFHTRGIAGLAFNNDGKLLATMGMDDQHKIAIYDWQKKKILYSAEGGQQKIFGMEYNPYTNQLVTCGDKHVKFWSISGCNLKSQKGLFGKVSSGDRSIFYTLAFTEEYTISGSSNGKIYLWAGTQLKQMIDAHKGAIYATYTSKELGIFYTGGKDGKVLRWRNKNLVKNSQEEITRNQITSPIRSICTNKDHVVIGTQRAEIYEVDSEDPSTLQLLLRGHYDGELWGLATNPLREGGKEYATCGDDKRIYVWDCAKKICLYEAIAGEKARTIEYSPDGKHLGVGLVNGHVEIYEKADGNKLNLIATLSDSKQWISDIKYSSNQLMVAGSHDCSIYLYKVDGNSYTLYKTLKGHNSYITHLDFSADGQYLQSNCGAYELLFWNTESGKRVRASSMKNTKWATWTCTLGWPVQGIWLPESDGTDINATCRALYDSESNSEVGVIATGDDYGKVNIFKYPCIRKNAGYHTYCGHSSHVTNLRFNSNNKRLFSIGGKDRSIFQWIIDIDTTDEDHDMTIPENEENQEEADEIANNWFNTDIPEGDEFMAVKPWVGAIKEPTTFKNDPNLEKEPNESIELEWVHGYSTGACRNNLGYSSEGDLVYHAAALGIIYDVDKHRMHFQRGHTDDITAFTINSDCNLVATGEVGKTPKICVWDAFSGCSIITMKGFHKRGIVALSFSPDSTKLASIGLDDDHSLAIYRMDGTMIAKAAASKSKILAVSFLSNGTNLVTVGTKIIKFWTLSGSGLTSKNGVFGRNGTIQTILCCVPCGSDCVTAQLDGSLYLWKGNQCTNQVKRHKGAVYALSATSDNGLVSGGSDGNVIIWGVSLTPLKTINLKDLKMTFPINTGINALCYDKSREKLLIGTRGSEILEVDSNTLSNTVLIRAHATGELWGLAIHPQREHYATAGDDKTVRIWDARDRTLINMITLKGSARAIAYSQHGSHLALGMQSGSLIVYSSDLKEIISTCTCSKKWIQTIQYSPCSSILAVGSHDNNIYLFNTAPYSRRAVLNAHRSYITHLDFTSDGKYLQSNCGAYELLFWNVETGKQIKSASSVRDAHWATWTCTLGWPVQGIWPPESDGTDVNAVDRSPDEQLIVTADDFMKIKLFRYPCINRDNKYKSYGGHSSHITNVRFSTSQCYVMSVGGNDKCVFQFKVAQ